MSRSRSPTARGDGELPLVSGGVEVPAESSCAMFDELVGSVLESDVEAAFALLQPLSDEAQAEDGLADSGRSKDHGGVSGADARRPSDRQGREFRWGSDRRSRRRRGLEGLDPREHLESVAARCGRCACRPGGCRRASSRPAATVGRPARAARTHSWMMPSANENSTPISISSGVYSPSSSSTASVCPIRLVRSYSAERSCGLVGEIAQHLGAVDHHDGGLFVERLADHFGDHGLQSGLSGRRGTGHRDGCAPLGSQAPPRRRSRRGPDAGAAWSGAPTASCSRPPCGQGWRWRSRSAGP